MAKFIENVVSELIESRADLLQTTIVLPGNRPMLFFRQAFQNQVKNSILPKFLSIDDFVKEISGLQDVSQIQLWFSAYNSYKKIVEMPDEFENFIKWIPTLLKDFDDINSSLVSPREIFDYLISAERIKKWGQENLEIGSNQLMSKHLNFWKMSGELFHQLNEDLLNQNKAYRGLIYRKAVEKLPEFLEKTNENFVFVGLNALSNAERKIIFELNKIGKAKLFWDSDKYYMDDENQEAGHFLRKYKEVLSDWNWEANEFSKPKKIQTIEIGKRVGQAKYLHKILSEIPADKVSETAVVLADETLLPAVLSAIPQNISKVNITMGFPLDKSSMAYFFRSVFELQMNREKLGNGKVFYYKNVLDIISNTIFQEKNFDAGKLNRKIRKENRIFNTSQFIQEELKGSIYSELFEIHSDTNSFVTHLMKWIEGLMQNKEIEINDLDKEYVYRFSLLMNQLADELKDFNAIQNFKTLYVLYNRLLTNETISFVGEPLEGLQLVGLLETRLLDFENVIMTSVNDGVIPPGRTENSFIPYDIRREMGMNTFTENDAVFAYHFYRLLQRAENISLLYNTEADGLDSGERSRFLAQMQYESSHKIENKIAVPEFTAQLHQPLEIMKTSAVMEALERWLEKGISASSLSNYLRNPIDFYQQQVLGVRDFEDAEETVGARVLGNIVHNSLEELYKPLLGKILVEKDFDSIFENSEKALIEAFQNEYGKGDFLRGKNHLVYKIAHSFIQNVIKSDQNLAKHNEFIVHELETQLESELILSNGKKVKLKGFIDRIDELNGIKRIIDFKTGNVTESTLNVVEKKLENIFSDAKFAKSLQLIFYAHLYFGNRQDLNVQFGIYPLKNPKKGLIPLKFDGETTFDSEILRFTNNPLSNLIEEILNPEISFLEKL
ncbi:PD-(D/E)XK nuclease family protein [Moheibacter sediminis]|uniref:PD-(D/E)XK nuclease superfamily protein n=1 Tax=Moheibacter sediminis TaxID=1434700 RepID=A0A1W2AK17_9FLAO|nr:PD-(D/E)XK nuclease family protein [Moheibacter sediminis]SMC61089.1 PD-(D/E)XK nuclease superfamily protein [Moheibacter sediminis]